MSDTEKEAAVAQDTRVENKGQRVTDPSVAVLKKRGPMARTSVYVEDPILQQIKTYAEHHGCKESDVIRAALAMGLQRLEKPYTVQGRRDTLADNEITRVEDAVTDGDFELARRIVRRLQLDDVPLTIRTRLTKSLTHRDYLTALHIVDRLAAGKELQ